MSCFAISCLHMHARHRQHSMVGFTLRSSILTCPFCTANTALIAQCRAGCPHHGAQGTAGIAVPATATEGQAQLGFCFASMRRTSHTFLHSPKWSSGKTPFSGGRTLTREAPNAADILNKPQVAKGAVCYPQCATASF